MVFPKKGFENHVNKLALEAPVGVPLTVYLIF